MALRFSLNGHTTQLAAGESLFDAAERLGVTVPSSCRKQGKCRECLVEIAAGADRLAARTPEEQHLKGDFRLSCCCRATDVSTDGEIKGHTLRRATMQVEEGAINLPARDRGLVLDPAVTRRGEEILLDGVAIDRGRGVAEGFGDDGHWGEFGEFVEGS